MAVVSGYTEFPTWLAPKWISEINLRPIHVKSTFEPFGQNPVINEFNAGKSDRVDAVVTTFALEHYDIDRLIAWANKVGKMGKVALQDPLFLAPGSDGKRDAMSNGLVKGASQTGTSLTADGYPNSKLIVGDGQYFQLGVQLLQATADANSDGTGNVTLNFWPVIKTSPADNDVIDTNNPYLHCQLLTIPERDVSRARLARPVSLGFREVV